MLSCGHLSQGLLRTVIDRVPDPMSYRRTALTPAKSVRFLVRQIHIKGIEVERQHGIKTHEHGQLRQALRTELLQSFLKSPFADAMGAIKFLTIFDHCRFFRLHRW